MINDLSDPKWSVRTVDCRFVPAFGALVLRVTVVRSSCHNVVVFASDAEHFRRGRVDAIAVHDLPMWRMD